MTRIVDGLIKALQDEQAKIGEVVKPRRRFRRVVFWIIRCKGLSYGFRIGFDVLHRFGVCLFWKTPEACTGRSFWGWK